jgi:hypothetical protein
MSPKLSERITQVVAIAGAALVLLAFVLWGAQGALGAFAGALVAMANWGVIRWVALRVTGQHVRSGGRLYLLLGLKTAALMGVCWLLLTEVAIHPKGFMIGIGALVIGIVVGPLLMSEKADNSPHEEQPDG